MNNSFTFLIHIPTQVPTKNVKIDPLLQNNLNP